MAEKMNASQVDVSVDSDIFLRKLIRELCGTLEDIVGLEEASGFISIVGQHLGEWMNKEYQQALDSETLSSEQVRDVLIDLKRRINGDFYLLSEDNHKIVLGNRRCPFGSQVKDRPSMCMITSNVFGTIAAENLGYAKVVLHKTIASGSPECRIVIHKCQTDDADNDNGRVYYKS